MLIVLVGINVIRIEVSDERYEFLLELVERVVGGLCPSYRETVNIYLSFQISPCHSRTPSGSPGRAERGLGNRGQRSLVSVLGPFGGRKKGFTKVPRYRLNIGRCRYTTSSFGVTLALVSMSKSSINSKLLRYPGPRIRLS